MRYTGGKHKIARPIGEFLRAMRAPGQLYVEPFVGAGSILSQVHDGGPALACDAHPDLIMLWQALQAGWEPPRQVSEEEYRALRHAAPSALRAFAGFGCAFGGDFFHGYARDLRSSNYADVAARGLLRKSARLAGVRFLRADYRSLDPRGALVYCDPPYVGTTGFSGVGRWDPATFWALMTEWSAHNTVIVSEATAPPDWEPVLTLRAPTGLRRRDMGLPRREEHLWRHRAIRPARLTVPGHVALSA